MNKFIAVLILAVSVTAQAEEPTIYNLYDLSSSDSGNVILLDFDGFNINNTRRNSSSRPLIITKPYDSAGDGGGHYGGFAQSEVEDIYVIWRIVSAAFPAFDVTTFDPLYVYGNYMAIVNVTESKAEDGECVTRCWQTSHSYKGRFGQNNYNEFRPTLIYADKLNYSVNRIADEIIESVRNELGMTNE